MSCRLRISYLPIRFVPFHLRFRQCGVLCRSYCKKRDNRGEIMEHVVFDGVQVMVGDSQLLQSKISSIQRDGPSKLQVIADFDATLTKYMIDGQRGHSSHALLQQGNPEYDLKRQKLYEYYHPLEIDPAIPLDEKAKLMEEWWEKTHALLVEGGLSFGAIKSSVAKSRIAFRDGVTELFELLERSNVPVLIFSAGLADIIEEVLRQKLHRPFKNVRIVSNRMVFDQNGNLVSFKGKTIHVLNKNEHAIDMAGPIHEQVGCSEESAADTASVKLRTNVLLLGDHIGDLGMSDGLNYNTRISVGFLNDNIESSSDSYRHAFDVVYMNDASMWGVVKLASQLCSTVKNEVVTSGPKFP
ncbi:5'-nucleotidase / magnesium ion binding protein [Perilla frutescens var. hirtella]|uniref:5'-nucleotidase n=1 Tax=Perilla frutescens var. hirtella TaxID=608512 RepID=A0AAD4J3F7_PERFH|nr:5'-nucleotidase / magnesium ion binding protein [Perilla frutescens var. hirtella]KAH6826402.1 5'-nucleotidase / magnesium ion binding protein [Perilla frutescens var. hirtella]